jgi:hypothetical protein
VGFQMAMVGDVDRAREQVLKVLGDIDVFPQSNRGLRRDIDQNVNVAVGAMVAARVRAEQRRMRDATRANATSFSRNLAMISWRFIMAKLSWKPRRSQRPLSAPHRPTRAAQYARR